MENRRIGIKYWLIGALLIFALSGCNRPTREATTPTASSQQVLQTARAIAQSTLDASSPTPTRSPPTDTPGPPTETFTPHPTGTPSPPLLTANYTANLPTRPVRLRHRAVAPSTGVAAPPRHRSILWSKITSRPS